MAGSALGRRVVHGVDFSAAADAGRRIWIATGALRAGGLRIVDLRRAAELTDFGPARTPCLAALRKFIADRPASVFGLDFPFGVTAAFADATCWADCIEAFAATYASEDDLRRRCGDARRVTDRLCGAPLAPANLRLYRQTYFGIRDVLAPLVRDDRVAVLPMQYRRRDRPWVVEICPAVTLAREGLRVPYKGREQPRRAAREDVLAGLTARGVTVGEPFGEAALEDAGGDALDAVVAAYAAARALARGFAFAGDADCLVEGWIYA